jgi:hypothetical protein
MEQVDVAGGGWADDWSEPWGTVHPVTERTLDLAGPVTTLEQADG